MCEAFPSAGAWGREAHDDRRAEGAPDPAPSVPSTPLDIGLLPASLLLWGGRRKMGFEFERGKVSAAQRFALAADGGRGEKMPESGKNSKRENCHFGGRIPAVRCTLCWAALWVTHDFISNR